MIELFIQFLNKFHCKILVTSSLLHIFLSFNLKQKQKKGDNNCKKRTFYLIMIMKQTLVQAASTSVEHVGELGFVVLYVAIARTKYNNQGYIYRWINYSTRRIYICRTGGRINTDIQINYSARLFLCNLPLPF